MFVLIANKKDILFGYRSQQQYKSQVKGDQAYTCNLQPGVTIFPGLYLILCFALCRYIYNMTYITCITYK